MKNLNKWSRKELLALPERNWQEVKTYSSLLVFSTHRKHDSGWANMAVIGVVDGYPKEIITLNSDDIEWNNRHTNLVVRTDCALKSGAIHFWVSKGKFIVGAALSSLTVKIQHE